MKSKSCIWIMVLSAIILFNSVKITFLYTFYELNNSVFTSIFCENKEKPELKCNGKCSLKKAVETPANDKNSDSNFKVTQDFVWIAEVISDYSIALLLENPIQKFDYYSKLYHYTWATDVFHPPLSI